MTKLYIECNVNGKKGVDNVGRVVKLLRVFKPELKTTVKKIIVLEGKNGKR